MQRIYLDHAATTPVDVHVRKKMEPYFSEHFGNPSALYIEGVAAKEAVENARTSTARLLGVHPDEIVFVGSGTESDNLAVQGVLKGILRDWSKGELPHIITSVIEHPAVLFTIRSLEQRGLIRASYIPVDGEGVVDLVELKEALSQETVLVSVMYANNEIGTIQPIKEIAKIVRDHRKKYGVAYPYLHTDACQAMNYLDAYIPRLGVDLLTCSGSKIYGPKGVGVLYIKRGVPIEPIVYGGGQEKNIRSGTENVPLIVGLAEALRIALEMREAESLRLQNIRNTFIETLLKQIPGSSLNGHKEHRLPNNINISIQGIESEMLVLALNAYGIACSAQSACKSREGGASYVIEALGKAKEETASSVRFTLGRATKEDDIDILVDAMKKILERQQRISGIL